MKTIGLIGGISYHSTSVYYDLINKGINEKLGDNNAAKLVLHSINYADYKALQSNDDWPGIENMLSDIAVKLENAGVDCILLCCNTAHVFATELKNRITIPFLHIADETAKEIVKHKIKKVGLLGTKFTMENPFFISALDNAGATAMIPDSDSCNMIHTAILTELSKGYLSAQSKEMFQAVIRKLKSQGAQAVIFGCTEIGMFVQQEESELPIFDTTIIHSNAAVHFALSINS